MHNVQCILYTVQSKVVHQDISCTCRQCLHTCASLPSWDITPANFYCPACNALQCWVRSALVEIDPVQCTDCRQILSWESIWTKSGHQVGPADNSSFFTENIVARVRPVWCDRLPGLDPEEAQWHFAQWAAQVLFSWAGGALSLWNNLNCNALVTLTEY